MPFWWLIGAAEDIHKPGHSYSSLACWVGLTLLPQAPEAWLSAPARRALSSLVACCSPRPSQKTLLPCQDVATPIKPTPHGCQECFVNCRVPQAICQSRHDAPHLTVSCSGCIPAECPRHHVPTAIVQQVHFIMVLSPCPHGARLTGC